MSEVKPGKLSDGLSINSEAHEGVALSWQNVSFSVPIKKKVEKELLTNISGHVGPGEIVAIMGGSGNYYISFLYFITLGKGVTGCAVQVRARQRSSTVWPVDLAEAH